MEIKEITLKDLKPEEFIVEKIKEISSGVGIGEVTPEKIEMVRLATAISEEELTSSGAFQYMAILHQDKVTGIRNGKRDFGLQKNRPQP